MWAGPRTARPGSTRGVPQGRSVSSPRVHTTRLSRTPSLNLRQPPYFLPATPPYQMRSPLPLAALAPEYTALKAQDWSASGKSSGGSWLAYMCASAVSATSERHGTCRSSRALGKPIPRGSDDRSSLQARPSLQRRARRGRYSTQRLRWAGPRLGGSLLRSPLLSGRLTTMPLTAVSDTLTE